jgi:gliding motility-associated-like protein
MSPLPLLVIPILTLQASGAQEGLNNRGSLRLHKDANLGFHTNFINNRLFESNLGLAGFYGEHPLLVSGSFIPVFHNMEVRVPEGLKTDIPVEVANTMNFIQGDINSSDPMNSSAMRYAATANYTGATDMAKVRGFVEVLDQDEFTFPVGDIEHLHPLKFVASEGSVKARCSYFKGLADEFPLAVNPAHGQVGQPERIIGHGYWKLECAARAQITLYWDEDSHLTASPGYPEKVTLAGWNIEKRVWEILGPVTHRGNLSEGSAESGLFIPDDYAAIAFGSMKSGRVSADTGNFLLSPNGDGINDVLEIPVGKNSNNNSIIIYDRSGQKVFEHKNYSDQFNGTANVKRIWVNAEKGLPEGFYFYLFNVKERGVIYQGFLYLKR